MMELVIALLVGYIIGLLQKGINITIKRPEDETPNEYNTSSGIEEYMDYADKTVEVREQTHGRN